MEKNNDYIKMDYNLPTDKRIEKAKEIILNTDSKNLTSLYLDKLSDYITEPITKKEKKEKTILTYNRLNSTINERELSFEGLIGKFENGEDGIYGLITNDKNIIFKHSISISEEDISEIGPLQDLEKAIKKIKAERQTASGARARSLHTQLIEIYKDRYVIKNCYKPKIKLRSTNLIKSLPNINLDEHISIGADGLPHSDGIINLYDKSHISALLCNYSKIKEDVWDNFQSDIHWLMEDLDNIIDQTFKDKYPMYYDLIIYKIDGKSNAEIQQLLYKDYDIKHSVEYISSLWRKKIPKMIAETASNNYLIWYYSTQEYGKWKRCSRCGQYKLAHNNFFSKNNTSKDGFYSICKECRNKKPKQIKIKKEVK